MERFDGFALMDSAAQAVCAHHLGYAFQFLEGVLQALHQSGERFSQGHLHVCPTRMAHSEVEQFVAKGFALDGNLQLVATGEVDLSFSSGGMLLRELQQPTPGSTLVGPGAGLRAFRQVCSILRVETIDVSFNRPEQRLPVAAFEILRMTVQQIVQDARRLDAPIRALLQQWDYLRSPILLERIISRPAALGVRPGSPVAISAGPRLVSSRPRVVTVPALSRVVFAGSRRRVFDVRFSSFVFVDRRLLLGLPLRSQWRRRVVSRFVHFHFSLGASYRRLSVRIVDCPPIHRRWWTGGWPDDEVGALCPAPSYPPGRR